MDHFEQLFLLFLHVYVVSLHELVLVLVKDLLHASVKLLKLLLHLLFMVQYFLNVTRDITGSKSILLDELTEPLPRRTKI